MAAIGFQSTNVNFKLTGTSASVPDNCFGRLMYYLNCIDSCVPDVIPARLRNYSQYRSLDNDDKQQVVSLARNMSPSLLNNVIFFPVDDGDLQDSSNEFVEISVAKRNMTAVATSRGTVLIGGQNVNAASIMMYEPVWLRKNYTEPLREASKKLKGCSIM